MNEPIKRRQPRTVVEACIYLQQRYNEQCLKYPRTREIPEAMYVSQNLLEACRGPWVEIEEKRTNPATWTRPSSQDESPSYRTAMRDSGRGHLIR